VLALDTHNNLLAGTEPSGRILRISRAANSASKSKDASAGEGFVLYETGKREVTALTVAPDGAIYAAAIGEKQRPPAQAPTTVITTPQAPLRSRAARLSWARNLRDRRLLFPFRSSFPPAFIAFRPKALLRSFGIRARCCLLAALNSDGRLLAGTGNSGALLAIDGRGVFAQLAKAGSAQITGIARNSVGKLFLCTATRKSPLRGPRIRT